MSTEMLKKVRVRAPSSTSNLGPGFDVCGLALDAFHDEVEVVVAGRNGIRIEIEGEGRETISKNPEENTAGQTALEFKRRYSLSDIEIRLTKRIPPGRGLGSSGVSAAATAVAIDCLLNLHLDTLELVKIAMIGEQVASGTIHADDISPALYGGFTIVQSYDPLRVVALPPPKNVLFALAVPQTLTKSTKGLRGDLPQTVPLKAAIGNVGSASTLVAGIMSSNPKLIGQGMMGDQIVEPSRISRFPVLGNVRKAALESGACGVTISGAGPTMIAAVDPLLVKADTVAMAMSEEFEKMGISCRSCVARSTGPSHVIEKTRLD